MSFTSPDPQMVPGFNLGYKVKSSEFGINVVLIINCKISYQLLSSIRCFDFIAEADGCEEIVPAEIRRSKH